MKNIFLNVVAPLKRSVPMYEIKVNSDTILHAEHGETLLDVLRSGGIRIPTLCALRGLSPTGACRLCVVELEDTHELVSSCSFTVLRNLKVNTHSERVIEARRGVISLLLSRHGTDCFSCQGADCCSLRNLALEYSSGERSYVRQAENMRYDDSNPCLVRDQSKCILCGKCVRVCREIQKIGATALAGRGRETSAGPVFGRSLAQSLCIGCAQCVRVCPTAGLTIKNNLSQLSDIMMSPKKRIPVAVLTPEAACDVALAYGIRRMNDAPGLICAALRRAGFKYVFDISCGRICKTAAIAKELARNIANHSGKPVIATCSAAAEKYIADFYPEYAPFVFRPRCPAALSAHIIRTRFALLHNLEPSSLYIVSCGSCAAEKYETSEGELDLALTSREILRLFRLHSINPAELKSDKFDAVFSKSDTLPASTSLAVHAAREACSLAGELNPQIKQSKIRSISGVRTSRFRTGNYEFDVATASGTAAIGRLLESSSLEDFALIEAFVCPASCREGGGQTHNISGDAARRLQVFCDSLENRPRTIPKVMYEILEGAKFLK